MNGFDHCLTLATSLTVIVIYLEIIHLLYKQFNYAHVLTHKCIKFSHKPRPPQFLSGFQSHPSKNPRSATDETSDHLILQSAGSSWNYSDQATWRPKVEKNFRFQLPGVLLEKHHEKFVSVCDRCEGSLLVWVISGVVRIVLDTISFQLLFLVLFVVLSLLYVALLFDFPRYHCGE